MKQLILLLTTFVLIQPVHPGFAQTTGIQVAKNVYVSRAHHDQAMREVLLSADPDDPKHLLACAIVDAGLQPWTVVYLSNDGGQSWKPTLETKKYRWTADPACVLGHNSEAYHVALGTVDGKHPTVSFSRSSDGGKTWPIQHDESWMNHRLDNASIAIDLSGSPFSGTVYVSGASQILGLTGGYKSTFGVWRSRNRGESFEGPVERFSEQRPGVYKVGNSVILSDGTLVAVFGQFHFPSDATEDAVRAFRVNLSPDGELYSISLSDGGQTISEASKIADFVQALPPDPMQLTPSAVSIPSLARDPGSPHFRDRLYAAWTDSRTGRSAVRFSYSADRGKTWTRPVTIDESCDAACRAPQNFSPTLAVNKNGVVLVTWYDRRENPDGLGWYVRARASFDGGESWLASTRVSDQPNTFHDSMTTLATVQPSNDAQSKSSAPSHIAVTFPGRQFFAGDYSGVAAAADGVFHALWVDDRTGIPQVWTARLIATGAEALNSSERLSKYRDASSAVQVRVESSRYDPRTNVVAVVVRLKNISKDRILSPIKLQLLNIRSGIGTAVAINPESSLGEDNARWDVSGSLTGRALTPQEESGSIELRFQIRDPQILVDGKNARYRLLDYDLHVLVSN